MLFDTYHAKVVFWLGFLVVSMRIPYWAGNMDWLMSYLKQFHST